MGYVSFNWPSKLQLHYGKNTFSPVPPPGGECKQIYTENVNKQAEKSCYQIVITLFMGFRIYHIWLIQGDLKEALNFYNNVNLDTFIYSI